MTSAILSPNGDQVQVNPASPSSQKRKFSEVEQESLNGDTQQASPDTSESTITKVLSVPLESNFIDDLLAILKRHDPRISILEFSLDSLQQSHVEEGTDQPTTKRAKFNSDTILHNLQAHSYKNSIGLITDVDQVSNAIIKSLETSESQTSQTSQQHIGRVLAFQKVLHTLLEQLNIASKAQSNGSTDIIMKSEEDDNEVFDQGQNLLTIYAQAQGAPKHLFSSLQKMTKVTESKIEFDDSVQIALPINEAALPNFISLTRAPPPLGNQKSKVSSATIAEKFGPPKNLVQTQPPKPSNKLVTKSTNVGWVTAESLARDKSRGHYNWSATRLSSGLWLGYNDSNELASPEEKRRQRDRTLSTGAIQPELSAEMIAANDKMKEEALFRAAFSSFAPCKDNTGAIVPDSLKGDLWWDRIGRIRSNRILNSWYNEVLELNNEANDDSNVTNEDEAFEKAVQEIDPQILEIDLELTRHEADKDMNDILKETTDLIETLYSHQRIRNSQLSSNLTPMTPVGSRNSLSTLIGSPSTPSSAENKVYKELKSRLASLLVRLPSNEISKFKVSKNIIYETNDDHGTLEDNNPKQSSQSQQTQASQRASGSYNQMQPQSQPRMASQGAHTPSTTSNRAGTTVGRTPTGGYFVRPNFNTAVPRPLSQSGNYGQTPNRVNYTQPGQYYQQIQQQAKQGGYGSYGTATPDSNNHRYTTQTPVARPSRGFHSQANATATLTGATPVLAAAAASSSSSSSLNLQNQYNSIGGTPSRPPHSSQLSTASGPTGFHTSMTAQEQQSLMDRQRAQLAAQNQARLGASTYHTSTPSREGSGTSRIIAPVQTNGT